MTKTQTTKTNHYFRALVALAALAMMAIIFAASSANASTTFTVNSTGDQPDMTPNDSICDADQATGTQCTLRAAIQQANVAAGADVINFNISGTGVHTISPSSELPPISDTVAIDGYTQPGASPNTLAKGTNAVIKVSLVGTNAGAGASGLSFVGLSDSKVRGLAINHFSTGVFVDATATFLVVEGNFIGTDPSGTTDQGNQSAGVFVSGPSVTIGSRGPEGRNLISGNDGSGIRLGGAASQSQVVGNLIGTEKSGTKNLGNSREGVEIIASSYNFVQNNTIAFNGGDGVKVSGGGRSSPDSSGDSILSNSIFSNGGLGINLVDVLAPEGGSEIEANDPGDADTGPNGLQNKPVLTVAKTVSGKTTIKGKLNSHPNETYAIQLFSNPPGTNEGRKLIAEKNITTDGSGNRSFTLLPAKVAVGRNITATATRNSTSDTSEFSAPRKVVAS